MTKPTPAPAIPLTGPGPWVRAVPPTMDALRDTLADDFNLTFPADQLAFTAGGDAVLVMVLPAGTGRVSLVAARTTMTPQATAALQQGTLDPRKGDLPDDFDGAVVMTTHDHLTRFPNVVADLAALALAHGIAAAHVVGHMTYNNVDLTSALETTRRSFRAPRHPHDSDV